MTGRRIVVMGVSGCGKSIVGFALAQRLGWRFLKGDSLHPAENKAAMAAGIAFNDAMRLPWLQAVAHGRHEDPAGCIASCSALRRSYRDILRWQGPVFFVQLELGLQQTRVRMQGRPDHFMNPALADSQHANLEPLGHDEWGITVDAINSTEAPIDVVCDGLQSHIEGWKSAGPQGFERQHIHGT